jgi:hypothetical protein
MLPALPPGRESPAYAALRRVFADHTMNTIRVQADGSVASGPRGVYRTETEDHLTVVLFECWSLFPDPGWLPDFLKACGAPLAGDVHHVGWSYAFEQVKGMGIADVVVGYRDDAGEAVLVIEAKRPGGANLGDKDLQPRSPYFDLPSIRAIPRQHDCFLVDAGDEEAVQRQVGARSVTTWQRMGGLQAAAAARLAVPASVRAFLVGALVSLYARFGMLVDPPPYAWLADEPTAERIRKDDVAQPRSDRVGVCWRSPRQRRS